MNNNNNKAGEPAEGIGEESMECVNSIARDKVKTKKNERLVEVNPNLRSILSLINRLHCASDLLELDGDKWNIICAIVHVIEELVEWDKWEQEQLHNKENS